MKNTREDRLNHESLCQEIKPSLRPDRFRRQSPRPRWSRPWTSSAGPRPGTSAVKSINDHFALNLFI